MNNIHPNDHELQRFLNKHSSELEQQRVQRHIQSCPHCRSTLSALLDIEEMLGDLPVLSPSSGFTQRIMTSIRRDTLQQSAASRGSVGKRPSWRPELVNGMFAAAATFLFISSGIIRRMTELDGGTLEAGVRVGALQWIETVQTLSQRLLS